MNTKRLFLGLELPSNIKLDVSAAIKKRESAFEGVVWVPDENLHVTLIFLGQVDEKTIPILKNQLASVEPDFPPFVMKTRAIKAFPNWQKCEVIVLEIENNPFFVKLVELYQQAIKQIPEIKLSPLQNIIPHITIGRAKKEITILKNNHLAETPKLEWEINEITLFESRLQNNQPPKYLPLASYKLSR